MSSCWALSITAASSSSGPAARPLRAASRWASCRRATGRRTAAARSMIVWRISVRRLARNRTTVTAKIVTSTAPTANAASASWVHRVPNWRTGRGCGAAGTLMSSWLDPCNGSCGAGSTDPVPPNLVSGIADGVLVQWYRWPSVCARQTRRSTRFIFPLRQPVRPIASHPP